MDTTPPDRAALIARLCDWADQWGVPNSLLAADLREAAAALAASGGGAGAVALEFAGYMATAADNFLDAFEHGTENDDNFLHDERRALASSVYEFRKRLARPAPDAVAAEPVAFQARVADWMAECFGPEISNDKIERNHRFIEEALELVQACGCTKSEAHQLVDYVFDRDQGDVNQEVGGVMVTLAALCLANGYDMHGAGETELARVWTKIEKIRAKQAAKPRHSPLPEAAPAHPPAPASTREDGQ